MMLLCQHKYVDRPNFEERKRLPEMIYWLDKSGAEVVASLEGSSLSEFTWRREPRWFQVEHDLAVNDFRLDLLEACHSAQDVTLETWVPESEFWLTWTLCLNFRSSVKQLLAKKLSSWLKNTSRMSS